MDPVSHIDINTTGELDETQDTSILAAISGLINKVEFADVSFYLNGKYIGGRPNDRG